MKLTIRKEATPIKFVPPSLKSEEGASDFYLMLSRPSRRQEARIQDRLIMLSRESDEIKVQTSTTRFELAIASVVGWDGVLGPDGEPVPFDGNAKTIEEVLSALVQEDYEALVDELKL